MLNALGGAIGGALGETVETVLGILPGLLGDMIVANEDGSYTINITDTATGAVTVSITIAVEDAFDNGTQVLTVKLSGSTFGEEEFEIGLDSRLISGLADILDWAVTNLGYTSATELIRDILNGGSSNSTISTISTILNLVGGLIGLDSILDLIPTDAATTEDLVYGLIENLLSGLYWYSSSEIKPLYDFYVDGLGESASDEAKEYAQYYADYDRAVYEGGMHGYMIGSVLVPGSSVIAGDTLGNGSYSATVPTSYAEVMQLKTELTYKRWLYPLLGVRECLVCFMPFVVLFIILSGVAAEKEMLYATGQETAKSKKNKKKEDEEEAILFAEESDKQTASETAAAEDVPVTPLPEEGTATLVADENDKEVL